MLSNAFVNDFRQFMRTTPPRELPSPSRPMRAVLGAYDARRGRDEVPGLRDDELDGSAARRGDRARDKRGRDEEGEAGGTFEFLCRLAKSLSEDDWLALRSRLLHGEEDADRAEDEPPKFKNRPRPGGAMDSRRRRLASDAAPSASFAERFPDAGRIRTGGVGVTPRAAV